MPEQAAAGSHARGLRCGGVRAMAGAYARRVSDEYLQERKGFWHEPDGTPTSEATALAAWALTAHDVLVETAGGYHQVIRAAELAQRLHEGTGIHTTRPHERWLDKVLFPVAALCERDGEPPLTSLVVTGEGDDLAAARRRLECYRWAGSAPEDGGEPRVVASAATGRSRAPRASAAGPRTPRAPRAPRAPREPKVAAPKRVAASDRPIAVCPRCFMALPATGLCDNCD